MGMMCGNFTEMQRTIPGGFELNKIFRMAFEGAPDGIAIAHNGKLFSVNPRFLDIFGYESMDEALALEEFGWIYPDQRRHISNLEENRKSSERPNSNYILAGIKKSGAPIAIEVSVTRAHCNEMELSVFHIRDNSYRIRVENDRKEILQESELRLKALMDAAPIACLWADLEGNVLHVNSCFKEYFGYAIEEFPTIEHWRRLAYPDEKYRDAISLPDVLFDDKINKPNCVWITCKNGATRYVLRGKTIAANRIMITYQDIAEWE
jgi:PAS domain S-box-containing protein